MPILWKLFQKMDKEGSFQNSFNEDIITQYWNQSQHKKWKLPTAILYAYEYKILLKIRK